MGWSLYSVARLPGQSTFDLNITSGKFHSEIFTMANAIKDGYTDDSAYEIAYTEKLTPDATNKITLTHTPVTGSVYIAKMEEATEAAAGKYTVSAKEITFAADDVSGAVEVSYKYTVAAKVAKIDNQSSAIGEALLAYPVYGSGDDCTESSIIGYFFVKVYRCRFTAMPGFDSSYKTAFGLGPLRRDAYRYFLNTEKLSA